MTTDREAALAWAHKIKLIVDIRDSAPDHPYTTRRVADHELQNLLSAHGEEIALALLATELPQVEKDHMQDSLETIELAVKKLNDVSLSEPLQMMALTTLLTLADEWIARAHEPLVLTQSEKALHVQLGTHEHDAEHERPAEELSERAAIEGWSLGDAKPPTTWAYGWRDAVKLAQAELRRTRPNVYGALHVLDGALKSAPPGAQPAEPRPDVVCGVTYRADIERMTCMKPGGHPGPHGEGEPRPDGESRLREALYAIIALDHHNHGPASRATELALAALDADRRAREGK